MNPGKLNQIITFNTKQTTKINGVPVINDIVVGTTRASVINQRLKDRMVNVGNEISNTVTFLIRYKQSFNIDNKMTITWSGSTYQIKDITPDTVNKQWKTIICEVITV